jgi:hypothetical protein
MEYIYVEWKHSLTDEPITLISEIDENRFETWKIELYSDGKVGFAYEDVEVMNAKLSTEPVPSIEEIATETEFYPKTILKEEFENFWSEKVL